MTKQLEKILLIRPGALGDTLMLLPAICALDPGCRIFVAGRRPGIEFLAPHVEQYFDMEGPPWHRVFSGCGAGESLPPQEAELVIGFMTDRDGSIYQNLRGCYAGARVFVYPSLPRGDDRVHVAQYVAGCLKSAGLALDPRAVVSTASERPLLNGCETCSRNYVVLHPGSGSKRKNYSEAFWSRLIRAISRSPIGSALRPLLLLGPAESEAPSVLPSEARSRGFGVVVSLSSGDLLKIMKNARVFIGHDSGVTHLAAMAGARTIAMFKSTDPVLWRPLGPRVAVIDGVEDEDSLMELVLDRLARWQEE